MNPERAGTIGKIALGILLPVLTFWSTMTLPINDRTFMSSINNFLWIASGVYFVLYLPTKGLGLRQWITRVLVVILAGSLFITAFQGAIRHRSELIRTQQNG